ncbi:MAG: TolB family protein, partial [Miltoncostaeaceae bacterium]
NIFRRDLDTSTTILVSRQSASGGGGGADGASELPWLSADGRYVAFESRATNLFAAADSSHDNIYRRDIDTSTTILVSRQSASDGGAGADAFSTDGVISADGRYVSFESGADNLSAEDDDAFNNVFRRDIDTETTVLVSRQSASDGGVGADEDSGDPYISPDGRYVGFDSDASNLSTDDATGFSDVFIRDLATSTTVLVSRAPGPAGAPGDDNSREAAISQDGRFVTFHSAATNYSGDDAAVTDVFRRQLLDDPPPPPPPLPPAPPVVVTGTPAAANCRPVAARGTPNEVQVPSVITSGYLATNQRTGSATIRRARGLDGWLNAGIVDADICGGAISDQDLGSTLAATVGALGPAPPQASPRPVEIPGAVDKGNVTFRADALQMCTNQRVFQLGILWAEALKTRIEGNLNGGDIADGTLTQGRLRQDLALSAGAGAPPTQAPSMTDLRTPQRAGCQTVSFTPAQAAINRRIAIASIVRVNELLDLLAGGLGTAHFADGSIARVDLAPGVVS